MSKPSGHSMATIAHIHSQPVDNNNQTPIKPKLADCDEVPFSILDKSSYTTESSYAELGLNSLIKVLRRGA
jgi:hypothetical protein